MKNSIFLVNLESNRSGAYNYSISAWKKWADNFDIDVFVISDYLFPEQYMKPNFYKYYAFNVLPDEYSRICIVDADTLPHPKLENVFDVTNPNTLTVVKNYGSYDWQFRSIENYKMEFSDFKNIKFDVWSYFNSGMMIVNRKIHFQLFDELMVFYHTHNIKIGQVQEKYGVGTDQPLINMFVQKNNVNVDFLPYRFNMQDMPLKNIFYNDVYSKIHGIYHYNAIPESREIVNNYIKDKFEQLWTLSY